MKDERPRLGVAPLVWDGKRYLLGQRTRGPNAGKFVIPGGGVELGETWIEAGRREVREEAGIEIVIVERAPYVMDIIGRESHRVCLVPLAFEIGGKLTPSDEVPILGFYTPTQIADMHAREEISLPVVGALRFWGLLARTRDVIGDGKGERIVQCKLCKSMFSICKPLDVCPKCSEGGL